MGIFGVKKFAEKKQFFGGKNGILEGKMGVFGEKKWENLENNGILVEKKLEIFRKNGDF